MVQMNKFYQTVQAWLVVGPDVCIIFKINIVFDYVSNKL